MFSSTNILKAWLVGVWDDSTSPTKEDGPRSRNFEASTGRTSRETQKLLNSCQAPETQNTFTPSGV